MRYELTDHEWTAIKPFLPNKPRGVPRVNDHRVLNGIFWVLRSGALGVTYLRRSVPTPLDARSLTGLVRVPWPAYATASTE